MADWTKATPASVSASASASAVGEPPGTELPSTASTSGVLRPDELARHVELNRESSGPIASRWVENRWSLRWDLADGRWFPSQILPHPTCSLTVEIGSHPRPAMPPDETVVVTGVVTTRFDVDLRGRGRVAGLRFRPGGLAALCGTSAAAWTDRVVAARRLLPEQLCATLADPDLAACPQEWAEAAETGLAGIGATPGADARYDLLVEVVADMLADRDLLSVAEVCRRHHVSARTLQRLFSHYVGVGPKWVLARYRMHDLVREIDAGYDGAMTDLAHRFGWYDQAHLIRDFVALVGVTPTAYRDRRDRDQAPT